MNQELITAIETTRVQLILYYGIGRYLSSKKVKKTWGTSVLETISSQLRKELPGLRGFSATSLKKMCLFYENWNFLEAPNSSVMTDELPDSKTNSSDTSDELTAIIPIADFKLSGINLADFPVEDFFKVPFSHHITIFSKVKNLQERYYYIHRVVEENLQVAIKPMGVTTYKSLSEMPEDMQKVLPDLDEIKKIM